MDRDRPVILLETINPRDLTPDDLDELASDLQDLAAEYEYEVAYEDQHGSGVTWHEVLRIWVPEAAALRDGLYVVIIGACTKFMRDRFKKKWGKKRPKSIIVHDGKTGEEIASWVIKDELSEPEEKTPEKLIRRKPKGRHRRTNG